MASTKTIDASLHNQRLTYSVNAIEVLKLTLCGEISFYPSGDCLLEHLPPVNGGILSRAMTWLRCLCPCAVIYYNLSYVPSIISVSRCPGTALLLTDCCYYNKFLLPKEDKLLPHFPSCWCASHSLWPFYPPLLFLSLHCWVPPLLNTQCSAG